MLKIKTKKEELPKFQQPIKPNIENQQNQKELENKPFNDFTKTRELDTKLNIVYANSLSEQLPEKDFNPFIKSKSRFSLFSIKTNYFKNDNNEPKIKVEFDEKNKNFKLSLNGKTEKLDLISLVNCYLDLKQMENNDNSQYLLIKQLFFYGDIINENNELFNNKNIIDFCSLLSIDKIKKNIENQNFDLVTGFVKNLILIVIEKLKKLIDNKTNKNIIDLIVNVLTLQIEINNLMIQHLIKNNETL